MTPRFRAFTLVEMVVAMTVSVAVLAMGIPRYNELVRQQEFIGAAHSVMECLREGQRRAVAPDNGTEGRRWSVVELTIGGSEEFTSCTLSYMNASMSFAKLPSAVSTDYQNPEDRTFESDMVKFGSMAIQYLGTGSNIASSFSGGYQNQSIYFYFGVIEKGALVRVVKGSESIPTTYSANGVSLVLPVISSVDPDFAGFIRIPKTGAPIQLTRT